MIMIIIISFFVTVYDDAGICITKVRSTSLGTITYRLFSFTVF